MKKVAIIGAGAAGLVSAREVLRSGFEVSVFEAASEVGGVWVYSDEVEDDLTGINPRQRRHGSLYASLTTNLPRDLMAFSDYTFDSKGGGDDDWHRFPSHEQVLTYLNRFAADQELLPHIRFNSEVTDLKLTDKQWCVSVSGEESRFDAVMVCSGHYARPRIPGLPGIQYFKGPRSHSHNYRRPVGFEDQTVFIWGTSASGFDIGRELTSVAQHVYVSGNAFAKAQGPVRLADNFTGLPTPSGVDESGRLLCGDQLIDADHLMFCTGYEYSFPYLDRGIVAVDDNYVSPLYRDLVHPEFDTLSFIGLPYLVVPFPLFEIQAKWFLGHLNGTFELPDVAKMKAATSEREQHLASEGVVKRHFHRLGLEQQDYFNQLAADLKQDPMPAWFIKTWHDVGKAREKDTVGYKEAVFPVRGPTVCT